MNLRFIYINHLAVNYYISIISVYVGSINTRTAIQNVSISIRLSNWCSNNPIDPYGGHIEGRFSEALYSRKLDERTGEFIGNVYTGIRDRYYLPWSKKNVDEIIANSAHSTKESIKFIIKFGMEDSPDGFQMTTRNMFSYDQFVNWDWQRLKEWQYYPVDELFNRPKAFKAKPATLEFKPQ